MNLLQGVLLGYALATVAVLAWSFGSFGDPEAAVIRRRVIGRDGLWRIILTIMALWPYLLLKAFRQKTWP